MCLDAAFLVVDMNFEYVGLGVKLSRMKTWIYMYFGEEEHRIMFMKL
jgi:hypothetical protein